MTSTRALQLSARLRVAMQIDSRLTDEAILIELGSRLARHRIDLGLTQAQLATEAGVSKRTIERLEAGASAQSVSLLRVLRVLTLSPRLDALVPAPGPRPLDLLRLAGKERRRVRSSKRTASSSEPATRRDAGREPDTGADRESGSSRWTWGDDS